MYVDLTPKELVFEACFGLPAYIFTIADKMPQFQMCPASSDPHFLSVHAIFFRVFQAFPCAWF